MEENKKLDAFIRKSVKEAGLENPADDFTDLVWAKIQAESEEKTTFQYQPIFSKTAWFIIFTIVVAIFAYVIFGSPNLENIGFPFLQLNTITAFNVLGRVPDFNLSSTMVYSILIFTFFLIVQVFVIQYHFKRRYDLS